MHAIGRPAGHRGCEAPRMGRESPFTFCFIFPAGHAFIAVTEAAPCTGSRAGPAAAGGGLARIRRLQGTVDEDE